MLPASGFRFRPARAALWAAAHTRTVLRMASLLGNGRLETEWFDAVMDDDVEKVRACKGEREGGWVGGTRGEGWCGGA